MSVPPLEGLIREDEGLLATELAYLGCRTVGLQPSPAYAARWGLIDMAHMV
jgi:hypothetical protein